ncbi:hypothetical protein DFJ74DRAFT_598163, partial [Hyaloraphidium curvatum]
MFTGIVEHVGEVLALAESNGNKIVTVGNAGPVLADTKVGDQLSVNGVRLTVQSIDEARTSFTVNVTPESARRSNLGRSGIVGKVNLERPLHKDSRFGGHFVQGHIDTTSTIVSIAPDPPGSSKIYTFEIPAGGQPDPFAYIVPKGNITLDGASLTVVAVDAAKRTFSILLTPYTAAHVTLGVKPVGAKINVEVDVVGKYVEKVVGKLLQS